jgi:hypothetical protein
MCTRAAVSHLPSWSVLVPSAGVGVLVKRTAQLLGALLSALPVGAQEPSLRLVTQSRVTVLDGKAIEGTVSPQATVTYYATDSLSRMRVLPGETAPTLGGSRTWAVARCSIAW